MANSIAPELTTQLRRCNKGAVINNSYTPKGKGGPRFLLLRFVSFLGGNGERACEHGENANEQPIGDCEAAKPRVVPAKSSAKPSREGAMPSGNQEELEPSEQA